MFVSQWADMMTTVLSISKKREMTIETPRVGTSQVDKIVVHMLKDLDSKLDKAEAENAKLREELEGFKSVSRRQVDERVMTGEL